MFKRWFRPRAARDDDVIWEIKSRLLWFVPAKWGWGYREYANAASHRNRIAVKMNRMSKEFIQVIEEYAEAEASLKAESKSLDGKKYNHLWVGDPILLHPDEFSEMLPYVAEPEPEWKAFVSSAVWKRILKNHGVDGKQEKSHRHPDSPQNREGMVMISPSPAIESHPEFFKKEGAEQLLRYRAPEKKSSSSGNKKSSGSKKNFKALRKEYPQQSGESQNEWDNRLREIQNSE